MSDTNRAYEIRTPADFLAIPEDKIEACLRDFSEWLATIRVLRLIEGVKAHGGGFTWIDDGIPGISEIRLMVVSKEEFEALP